MPASDAETRFVTLAREIAEPLRRYVVRRTDPDTAQDVLAETMLVLWRRLDDVPRSDPLPWCYGVTKGCLANAQRAQRRRQRLAARVASRTGAPPPHGDPAESATDPALHAALAGLPATDRELLRLWAWEDLAVGQIATVLGITPNAVSIRLHRAKGRLAAALRQTSARGGHEAVEEGR